MIESIFKYHTAGSRIIPDHQGTDVMAILAQ